ncbi:MAG: hypothetical protein NTY12_00280 [Candidatus Falkowbacteria bacterium]|nr:hypothetical protein [Candidatus Falkowbacteria bacterium]
MGFKEIKNLDDIVPHEGAKINSISISKTGELRGIDVEPISELNIKEERLDEKGEELTENFEKAIYGNSASKKIADISHHKYIRSEDRKRSRNDKR